MAITPNGKTVYVTNYEGTVPPISTATNTTGPLIPVGGEPVAIAITPNGKTAYVTSDGASGVTPISTATNTAGAPIPVGLTPLPSRSRRTARPPTSLPIAPLVAVTRITTATNTAGPPIRVGAYEPGAIDITPDGKTAYIADSSSVIPITTATNTTGLPIPVGSNPQAIAVTPDGKPSTSPTKVRAR